jgi:hypothetical protein
MIAQDSVLVQFVGLVDHLPAPESSTAPRRLGSPPVYSDALCLKMLRPAISAAPRSISAPIAR